jgi:hypothetical protein
VIKSALCVCVVLKASLSSLLISRRGFVPVAGAADRDPCI